MQEDDVMQNGSSADKQINHFSYSIRVTFIYFVSDFRLSPSVLGNTEQHPPHHPPLFITMSTFKTTNNLLMDKIKQWYKSC